MKIRRRVLLAFAMALAVFAFPRFGFASMICVYAMVPEGQLSQLAGNQEGLEKTLLVGKGTNAIDIDKAWHGIHWLLTKTPWSTKGDLAQVILGGREIGKEIGYGRARAISASQVKRISETLANITEKELRRNFDPAAMDKAQIYPEVWVRDKEEGFKYLLRYYQTLKLFFTEAARKGDAVVVAII